jgi:uncharacterized cofD-like protein
MKKKTVVMGGGTGTFPVVSGLKGEHLEIASVIAVSDSGGSTGRIRDEFGFQPVGDLRQALAALAEDKDWIRKILLYRFNKGNGLEGHNLGNLILTALQDMSGDTTQALEIATRVFRLDGKVIPATPDNVNLEIEFEDGEVVVGEHLLDEETTSPRKIKTVRLVPHAIANPVATQVLEQADMIVVGPGDYYASIMATLKPEGMASVISQSSAKLVYIVNLMTRITQTHGMTAKDHLIGIEKEIGRSADYVLLNSAGIPDSVLHSYAESNEFPVVDDLGDDPRVVRADVISESLFEKAKYDAAHRSLLRHDSHKLGKILKEILER